MYFILKDWKKKLLSVKKNELVLYGLGFFAISNLVVV